MKKVRILLLCSVLLGLSSCATPPPQNQDNACVFLKQNRAWYKATARTAKRWGAPIGLQLAFIKQESSFRHDAKPKRGERRLLGLLPGKRPSSAYGYAQALDGTWEEYKQHTGNNGAERDDFDDATDFIGWYINRTGRRTKIGQYDYRDHYLAYHDGAGGYLRGTWKKKKWLIDVANKLHANATRYEKQVRSCHKSLKKRWLF